MEEIHTDTMYIWACSGSPQLTTKLMIILVTLVMRSNPWIELHESKVHADPRVW